MALLLSASQLALLRRQFFSQLSGEDLAALSENLVALVGQVGSDAGAAQSTADSAVAAAAAAQAKADAAATPAQVSSAVAGLATEDYADAAAAAAAAGAVDGLATEDYADAAVAAAVVGLASEAYVDGKFTSGGTGDVVVQSTDPTKKVTLSFSGGLFTGSVEEII